jgi:UPF0755 protein
MGYLYYGSEGCLKQPTTVLIKQGTSLQGIAQLLYQQKVICSPNFFVWMAWISGTQKKLHAGLYQFNPKMSPSDVLTQLAEGDTLDIQITVREGLTVFQVIEHLKSQPGIIKDQFAWPKEGSLLPETFTVKWGTTLSSLLKTMSADMEENAKALWAKHHGHALLDSLPEVLTLASIVEKETAVPDERPRIAGVFLNRLKKGMPLQADPTVVYAVSEGKGALDRLLTREDLKKEAPHNTYQNKGLPPTPIANPSLASIEAVLNPLSTKELYFVANGKDGRHLFANTLSQHNKNVQIYKRNLRRSL